MIRIETTVNNTPVLIYYLGHSQKLNWKRRYIINIPSKINKIKTKGHTTWVEDGSWSRKFDIDSNTVIIINTLDEDPLSHKDRYDLAQYLDGGVSVAGDKLSIGLVYIVVYCEEAYSSSANTLVIDRDISKK